MIKRIVMLGLAMTAGIYALPSSGQGVTCENAVFNEQIVTRFPNVRKACLAIETQSGATVAKVKARLVRTQLGNRAVVRFEHADGTRTNPQTIEVSPDFRVMVNGQPTRLDQLAVDQDLTAYLKVDEPVIALAPAEPTTQIRYVALVLEPAPAPAATTAAVMPKTGTHLPAVLLAGMVLGAAGMGLTMMRKSRAG